MITYNFECISCKEKFEKFRFGIENLNKWKNNELIIKCPKCGKEDHKQIIAKGSGMFKNFKW